MRTVHAVLCAPRLAPASGDRVRPSLPHGTVRDASGAVLPGVTVEASSRRSSTKDTRGRQRWFRSVPYRRPDARHQLSDLHAARFSTVKARRDRAHRGSQTLTMVAEMKVGGLEETITVTE